ncbi:MAG TPA: thiamine pyrophosphate-binding protein [Thermomicrobiales bacterium]|nr:thiamine pyrophosphate-binding protein [Thermomicrobiales bacterium]
MHDLSHSPTGMVRIADYLVERLMDNGVETAFGVPGDFVLRLFEHIEQGPLEMVNTCDEQGAGFAADAYARIRGLGAVFITWGVGGLKIANTTAQAFAEESPVVVISGTPSTTETAERALLHHMVDGYDTQLRVFEQITVATAVLDDPETACREIDRVIEAAMLHKRPVYIEIPRDMTLAESPRPASRPSSRPQSDPPTLAAAVDDAIGMLETASRPVSFVGIQVARLGLLDKAVNLVDHTSIPVSVMPMDKSAFPEDDPRFIGVYAGKLSRAEVVDFVENADCVLMLGTLLTDTNMGAGSAKLPMERTIHVQRDRVRIGYRTYERVRLEDFLDALLSRELPSFNGVDTPRQPDVCSTWQANASEPVTVRRMFDRLGCFLERDMTVIADPGDAMFGSLDLPVHRDHGYLANAFYASLGFAVPASIGVQMADRSRRPVVLVGDGAFQMTGMELATSLRYGLSPIVIILNNAGYTTERLMIDGTFNDVLPWNYTKLIDVFGGGTASLVKTEGELDRALDEAAKSDSLCIIEIRLETMDASDALLRLTEGLGMAAAGNTAVS